MRADEYSYAAELVVRRLYDQVLALSDSSVARATSELLTHARALHRELDREHISPGAEILFPVSRGHFDTDGELVSSLGSLVTRSPHDREGTSIWVLPGGRYRIRYCPIGIDAVPGFVKYVIQPFSSEVVIVGEQKYEVDPFPGLISPFALPYFRDLEAALQDYYDHRARTSSCVHLGNAWVDPGRLVLVNKPEKHMRRSLHEYLTARLRDASPDVLQEQNVNETEPVDIRIQWLDSRRISLIEVKWMGDSAVDDGSTFATKYREARAREGYEQTYGYVGEQRKTLPGHIVRGRVVVFDARRGGLREDGVGTFSSSDPWAYAAKDIDYGDVLVDDGGLEEPLRFFMEPEASTQGKG